MFSTSFWAVPALRRVDPARISGPTSGQMRRLGRLHGRQPSAGSGPEVDEPAAVPNAIDDGVDGVADGRQALADGGRHPGHPRGS
jgi:hypothetical protein